MLKRPTRSRYSFHLLSSGRVLVIAAAMVSALAPALARAADESPDSAALPATALRSAAHPETGMATYYAARFDGRRTASGVTFRNSELMAAHSSHPFGTKVRVTNLDRGSFVDVLIADRGGFGKGRGVSATIIDLSQAAAQQLDMLTGGRVRVLVEVLEWGKQADHKQMKRRLRAPD